MRTDFHKMHGAGNDFVVLDWRDAPRTLSAARAAALADRRTGIGCDQLIVLAADNTADAFMHIRNADGSDAEACGNALRCVALLLAESAGRPRVTVRSVAGLLAGERLADGRVRADLGPPALGWEDVPLARAMDTLCLDLPGGPAACSMGNPHATFFVPELDRARVLRDGAALEHHPLFPQRANIGFAQVLAPDRIRLMVWERGAGLTPACGSGACAALVNAHRRGLAGRRAEIVADGGALEVEWGGDDHVHLTGPAVLAYSGSVELDGFPA